MAPEAKQEEDPPTIADGKGDNTNPNLLKLECKPEEKQEENPPTMADRKNDSMNSDQNILALLIEMKNDIRALRDTLTEKIDNLATRLDERVDNLATRLDAVENQQQKNNSGEDQLNNGQSGNHEGQTNNNASKTNNIIRPSEGSTDEQGRIVPRESSVVVSVVSINDIKKVVENDSRGIQLNSPQELRTSESTACIGDDLWGNVEYLRTNFLKRNQGNVDDKLAERQPEPPPSTVKCQPEPQPPPVAIQDFEPGFVKVTLYKAATSSTFYGVKHPRRHSGSNELQLKNMRHSGSNVLKLKKKTRVFADKYRH